MRRGTNATHTFTLPEDSTIKFLTDQLHIYINYVQGNQSVLNLTHESTGVTVQETSVSVALSQVDTLAFRAGIPVKVQLRWVNSNDEAWSSNVMTFNVDDVLNDDVIYYTPQTTTQQEI